MSVLPGAIVKKDPSAELVYTFDWTAWLAGASIATSVFEISGGPDALLTKDNESIVSGSQMTRLRLLDGTPSGKYNLTNRIVTNEAVPQTDDRHITVWVVNT